MKLNLSTFTDQLSRCFDSSKPRKVLVALSGGVDSMCLTYLLAQSRRNNPNLRVFAATIDHAYRANSAQEATAVGSVVSKWNVDHFVGRLSYRNDPQTMSNFEEVARTLRYEKLREICVAKDIDTLLVAHNFDDCLETFLQRLLMNSTIFGLAGLTSTSTMPLPPQSPEENIQILRPLLKFSKKDIRDFCTTNNVTWFEDVSNTDTLLTQRNKLRYMINEYVPEIQRSRPEVLAVSREQLSATLEQIQALVASYNTQKQIFDTYVKQHSYVFNTKNCSISFSLPSSQWRQFNNPVIAKWLYEQVYPLSSAKNYHWSYAKFERQAMERIQKYISSDDVAPFQLNYVGVLFQVKKRDNELIFKLSKQPPLAEHRNAKVLITSKWHLFANTWWIRLGDNYDKPYFLRWYNVHYKKKVLEKFPELKSGKDLFYSRIGNVPILVDECDTVVGLPTHGLYDQRVAGQCRPKTPLF